MLRRRPYLPLLLVIGSLALLGSPVAAAEPAAASPLPALRGESVPPDESLEEAGAVIGHVEVRVEDVFDPSDPREDRWLYRTANRLHPTTRQSAIASQLPFRAGDRYSRRLLDEGERTLRHSRYLYGAEIEPVRWDGHTVDLVVAARDTWTLKAGFSLGVAGGATSSRFQVQDLDLFGTGKSLTFERRSDVDRTSLELRYADPNVLGTHNRLALAWADNSDGHERSLAGGLPFYSLHSRWSLEGSALDSERVETLYALGHEVDRLPHQRRRLELRGGLAPAERDGWVTRWTAGLAFQDDRFPGRQEGEPDTFTPRTLAYPWVGISRLENRFSQTRNLDQIDRIEDLALGSRWELRLGLSSRAWGATADEAIFAGSAAHSWVPGDRQLLLAEGHADGRLGRDGLAGTIAGGSLRYYHRNFGEQLFFATLSFDAARGLDPGEQLLLGGDNGLRGYPLRYQDGEQRALLTLEQRVFTPWYPFRLVHVGAAAFVDVGQAWGGDGVAADLGLLRDVGIGLRLASSRSGLGSVTHVDLAFPLDGDPSISKAQVVISTRQTF